jgi:CelD/BcsL family acetyltransferase involved in cellulose biosynthesis
MSETPDSYEVLAEPEALFALEAEWDALLAGSREQRFSQSCAWCRATWDAVDAPRGRSLLDLVVRNDARMVALWPVVLYRTGHWKVARPLGCAFGEYSDVLVLDDVKAEARALAAWRELRRVSGCDIVRLTDVRTGSLLHEMMQR